MPWAYAKHPLAARFNGVPFLVLLQVRGVPGIARIADETLLLADEPVDNAIGPAFAVTGRFPYGLDVNPDH